jgi:hypothetical protein
MNHYLKIKIVALIATFSGCALGTCYAVQVDENSTGTVGSGFVQAAERTNDGAFGTVRAAQPLAENPNVGNLPPIVSPANAVRGSFQPQQMVLPPIVTPFKAEQSGARGYNSPEISEHNAFTKGFAVAAEKQPASTKLFAPLVPIYKPTDLPNSEIPSGYAPAPVIQATTTPFEMEVVSTADDADPLAPKEHLSQGISAAGIPLYPKAARAGYTAPKDQMPPIVQGNFVTPAVDAPAIVQGTNSVPMPPVISPDSQIVSPMNTLGNTGPTRITPNPTQTTSRPMVRASTPMRMSTRQVPSNPMMPMESVIDQGMINQGQTYFSNPPMEAPVMGLGNAACNGCGGNGCPECGVPGTAMGDVAGCQSCGPNGCFNGDAVSSQFNSSGSVSWARRYLILDAYYIDRYDGTVTISNFGGLNNFEDELFGAKITIGNREDAANGREFVYFGTAKLAQTAIHNDPAGRIDIGYGNDPLDPFRSETTAFRNATDQAQTKQTTFQSVEFNKNDWGWDVMRTFWGFRYIYVQDDYELASRNLFNEKGLFQLHTQNNLFGPQIGYELFYDVGYRLSASTMGKFGLYANPNVVKTRLFNAGAQFLDLTDTNTAFTGTIELGINIEYKIAKSARLRLGYNAFYLSQVAGVSDNVPVVLNPTTGSDTSDSGEMMFNGVFFGFEIFRQ